MALKASIMAKSAPLSPPKCQKHGILGEVSRSSPKCDKNMSILGVVGWGQTHTPQNPLELEISRSEWLFSGEKEQNGKESETLDLQP